MLVGVELVDQKTDIAMACIIRARSSLDHDDSRSRTARPITARNKALTVMSSTGIDFSPLARTECRGDDPTRNREDHRTNAVRRR
jgi:hypothetical protein